MRPRELAQPQRQVAVGAELRAIDECQRRNREGAESTNAAMVDAPDALSPGLVRETQAMAWVAGAEAARTSAAAAYRAPARSPRAAGRRLTAAMEPLGVRSTRRLGPRPEWPRRAAPPAKARYSGSANRHPGARSWPLWPRPRQGARLTLPWLGHSAVLERGEVGSRVVEMVRPHIVRSRVRHIVRKPVEHHGRSIVATRGEVPREAV